MVTGSYFIPDSHYHQAPVKTESSPSPNLLPASLQPHYQLSFTSQYHSSHLSSQPPSQPSVLRFGVSTSFNPPMDFNRQWQTVGSSQSSSGSGSAPKYDNNLDNAMSFNDGYDGMSDLLEIGHGEKTVRRRSSKACDQCRKSKCKCERSSPNEPCRSCVLLGTPCTFLGPSRKRGPPKGYIDAIETRLHQTEALLGIVLACADERAETLIRDLSQDPLAREIINRVDHSPYGVKGRQGGNEGERASGKSRYAVAAAAEAKDGDSAKAELTSTLTSTHPSNEWQDRVTAMLRSINQSPKQNAPNGSEDHSPPTPRKASATRVSTSQEARLSDELPAILTTASSERNGDGSVSPGRRQRRKVSESNDGPRDDHSSEKPSNQSVSAPVSTVSTPVVTASSSQWPSSASSTNSSPGRPPKGFLGSKSSRSVSSTLSPVSRDSQSVGPSAGITGITPSARPLPNVLSEENCSPDSDDEQLTGAVGQLSLNEEEQVRYHGKVSGLHLLGSRDRTDHINEGGIWRFPKAKVWPITRTISEDDEGMSYLPPPEVQEHLLDVYFRCVHPSFPVIHKRIFYDALRSGPPTLHSDSPPQSQTSDSDSRSTRSSSSPPYNRRPRRVPALLLFTMFSIAARYSNHRSIPPKPLSLDSSTTTPQMWAAGNDHLEQASRILDKVYPNSRPSTCLALLLMGYREVGMGSMAQAWTYTGMAIRMAQDLGMHRSADRWERVGLGGRLFGDQELQERRRIWYGCVIMDKYVSAYIGRPLMIFERDFDSTFPSADDPEEMQEIRTDDSAVPLPGRIISCFNSAAGLSGILSMIIQTIYAVRPVSSRHGEAVYLEGILAKWYHELPEHLQYQPLSFKHPAPLPHVLTLHLQYWCAVLLLHRPFIPISLHGNPRYSANAREKKEGLSITKGKSYELSAGAANHITSIASLYMERYSLDCCPVFLCYYVFTAGIMHVTTLSAFSNDPQGRLGLQKCLDLLKAMEMVWPSATCALELLRGAKVDVETTGDLPDFTSQTVRHKRPFEQASDMDEDLALQYPSSSPSMPQNAVSVNRHQHPYDQNRHSYPNDLHHSTPTFYNYATSTNYQRWPSESEFDTIPYNGTVSTSVLPQIYSTGLVEDRMPAMGRPVTTASPHSVSNDPRYPHEAWNDYSSFTHHTISHHHSSSYPHHPSSSHSFHSEPPYNS